MFRLRLLLVGVKCGGGGGGLMKDARYLIPSDLRRDSSSFRGLRLASLPAASI